MAHSPLLKRSAHVIKDRYILTFSLYTFTHIKQTLSKNNFATFDRVSKIPNTHIKGGREEDTTLVSATQDIEWTFEAQKVYKSQQGATHQSITYLCGLL